MKKLFFLKFNYNRIFIVENVNPYYQPLIEGQLIQRHLFWSNKKLNDKYFEKDILRSSQIKDLETKYGFDLSKYKIKNKRQILRNCVDPEIGLYIFNEAFRDKINE